jgi:hypothetical protein
VTAHFYPHRGEARLSYIGQPFCFASHRQKLHSMLSLEVSEWYGVALGGVLMLWLLMRVSSYLFRKWATWSFRYFVYPRLRYRWILIGGMSPVEILLLLLYIGSNGFCMAFRATSTSEVSSRAAILSTINMVPLMVGSRLSVAADLLGVANGSFTMLHRWIGLVSTVQGVTHTVLSVSDRAHFQWNSSNLFGFIVSQVTSS